MFDHPLAESMVPEPWRENDDASVTNPIARVLKKLIVIKILRPDRLLSATNSILSATLGDEIVTIAPVDLAEFA